jgi:hypothetical protein
MGSRRLSRRIVLVAALLAMAVDAAAWPVELMTALFRDGRRLVPRSLARLLGEREREALEDAQRFPTELSQAIAVDLQTGRLRSETLLGLQAEVTRASDLLRHQRISEGLIRLGGLMRIPADLADPVLSAGAEGYPPGVVEQYYAFVTASLPKIPVVLDDPPALTLRRPELAEYWQRLVDRSRVQSPVIRTELFRNGRVVDHRRIDFRSPVYGVASLSYSRAVTAVAATWLVIWRESHGDTTRIPAPREVGPLDAPGGPRRSPSPEAP